MTSTHHETIVEVRPTRERWADLPAGAAQPLRNKIVVITGAAGNLGMAAAELFQRAGAGTVLVDRSPDRLRHVFRNVAESGNHMTAGGIDLTNPESLEQLAAAVMNRFGRIDVLVNTVGGYRGGKPVHESDLSDWNFLFDVNVRTTLLCCRAVVPQMLKQQRGCIINVASRDGLSGGAGYAAYSASKSAILRLTESLAAELRLSDINVNAVLPGTIDTPQNREAFPDADYSRWVAPDAIAEVLLFLASDASRAVNGAAIPVYGKG